MDLTEKVAFVAGGSGDIRRPIRALVFAHVAHMLVSVTDPDNPDYPGIPDGARRWRLNPVIPDLPPQAASSRCQDAGLAPRA